MIVSFDDFNIGEIKDFYFDDQQWTIRYFVVNTGSWLNERLVLISPYTVTKIDWGGFNLHVNLTKSQVEGCPTPDTEKPVSRLYEEKYSRYYQLPFYWTAADGLWPNNIYPSMYANKVDIAMKDLARENAHGLDEKITRNHLRSYCEVMGYKIHARHDVFGHVEDMVLDEQTYKIQYLIIDTVNFLPSASVLIPPHSISKIDWENHELHTELEKETVKHSRHFRYDRPIEDSLR